MTIQTSKPYGRAVRFAAGAAALAFTVSACSSSGTSGGGPAGGGGGAGSASPGGSASSATSTGGGAAVTVVAHHGTLGTYLTDSIGIALYAFAADKGGRSACTGACVRYWPPLTTAGPAHAGGGAKSADLGTIRRTDGTRQVTYAGHPLYRYAGDTAAGDTSGQGLSDFGGSWWLLRSSGAEITSSGGSGSSPSYGAPSYGGGY